MTPPEFRIISIGTLAAHPLWEEKAPARTGHATTTLITAGDVNIIVNPSLPAQVLAARMSERTKVQVEDITHIFLTTFTPEHYRGLAMFEEAEWLVHQPERGSALAALNEQMERAADARDEELVRAIGGHIALLDRCHNAPDALAPGIDLFPLPGLSPGTCGLLLPLPTQTVLICGDAVATREHLEQGKVLPTCTDIEQAQESFREALEIADLLIPGRDNIIANPVRRMM